LQYFGDALRPIVRSLNYSIVIVRLKHQSTVAVLLKIEEAARSLDVSQKIRIACRELIIEPSAYQEESEIPCQFFVMPLANSKEVHYLAVEVIEHFDFGWFFVEEHLGAACERFDVRCMFGKERYKPSGKAILAADIRKRSNHESW
jgi:hypothetical protein